jgi:hypothetical protein
MDTGSGMQAFQLQWHRIIGDDKGLEHLKMHGLFSEAERLDEG